MRAQARFAARELQTRHRTRRPPRWVGKRHGGIGTRRSGDRLSGPHHDENKCGSLQCFCSSLLGALRFQTRKGAMWRHGLLLIKTRGNMPACSTSWGSNRAQMVLCSGPSSCAAPNNTDPPRFHSPNKQKKHTGESNPLRQTCNAFVTPSPSSAARCFRAGCSGCFRADAPSANRVRRRGQRPCHAALRNAF